MNCNLINKLFFSKSFFFFLLWSTGLTPGSPVIQPWAFTHTHTPSREQVGDQSLAKGHCNMLLEPGIEPSTLLFSTIGLLYSSCTSNLNHKKCLNLHQYWGSKRTFTNAGTLSLPALTGSNDRSVFVVNQVQKSHCSSDCIRPTTCLWDNNGSTGPDVSFSPWPLYLSGERRRSRRPRGFLWSSPPWENPSQEGK